MLRLVCHVDFLLKNVRGRSRRFTAACLPCRLLLKNVRGRSRRFTAACLPYKLLLKAGSCGTLWDCSGPNFIPTFGCQLLSHQENSWYFFHMPRVSTPSQIHRGDAICPKKKSSPVGLFLLERSRRTFLYICHGNQLPTAWASDCSRS